MLNVKNEQKRLNSGFNMDKQISKQLAKQFFFGMLLLAEHWLERLVDQLTAHHIHRPQTYHSRRK